jgi:hypothetical protein
MNIFALDNDADMAARMHCDKHVVKMVLETAQILSTVHHLYGSSVVGRVYKPTHKNHPSVKWAAECKGNYRWLYGLFMHLAREYTHRYNKEHKSWALLNNVFTESPDSMPGGLYDTTPFALAMPDVYKFVSSDPVECYRAYYMHEKADMLTYTNRRRPEWMTSTA